MIKKLPTLKLIVLFIVSLVILLTGTSMASSFTDSREFKDWWNGKGLLRGSGENSARLGSREPNPIFKTRADLEDHGIKFTGKYKGAMFYVTSAKYDGGGGRGYWGEQVDLGTEINLARILNTDALNGFKLFGNIRYRDSVREQTDPNEYVKADSMFQPNHMWSGTQFRLSSFGLEYSSKELLPIKDMVVVRGGWLQPNREFLDQPLSKLFLNNAIESSKGIGGNIKFSSSASTWGGTINVKLHQDVYIKNGLFMADPDATDIGNHGLSFQGYGIDTRRNGLWYMGETGVTPKFGEAKLDGKYAVGGYYYETRQSWSGGGSSTKSGRKEQFLYGFYVQADQMLWREPSGEPGKLKKEGLNLFSMASLAPDYTTANKYPYYYQTGLVYTGLLPNRDKDQTMIALAYGQRNKSVTNNKNKETYVIEGGYQMQINGWWWARPFIEYIGNPAGNDTVKTATVIGFSTGLNF